MFTLTWQPPYDWQWMLKFLGDRAVAGIEIVTPTDYTRSFACQGYRGLIHVTPQPQAGTLQVVLSDGLLPIADPNWTAPSKLVLGVLVIVPGPRSKVAPLPEET